MSDRQDIDRRLLAVLRKNARASVTELAAAVGVSRTTIKTRLDMLVEHGRIRRFTIETDVDVDGAIRAITLVELQGKMSRSVIQALHGIPEVSSVFSTNGSWDLVIEITTDNLTRFDQVLREIREAPGVLNSESNLLLARV